MTLVDDLRWCDEQAAVEETDEPLQTTTVSSVVADSDKEHIGHVLMLDYDDVDPAIPIADAQDLDGLTVVSRSSPGSYHVVDLRVSGLSEVAHRARQTSASSRYIDDMTDRDEFVLRVAPKMTEQGEVAVTAPVPIAVDPGDVRLDRPLSEPHGRVLLDLAGLGPDDVEQDLRYVLDERETVGDLLVRERRRVGTLPEDDDHV